MSIKKKIIIIGSGMGGYTAAIRAAQLDAQVILIEKDALGGTCLNRGCIPTKAMLRSADVLSLAKGAEAFGVRTEKVSLDFPLAIKRKDTIVKRLVDGVGFLMRKNKIKVIEGTATIVDPKTVKVVESKKKVSGDNIIIATGSQPSELPVKGTEGSGIMTSDGALVLKHLPKSVLIIGGGIVGVEFAQIFGRMGANVTIVEVMPQILPAEDTEIAGILSRILKGEGIEIFINSGVTSVTNAGRNKKKVLITGPDGDEERIVEKVLVAVGRTPYTDGLGLKKLGVKMKKGRIEVSERMETSIPGIYAIGDVTGGIMLAHVAMEEGKRVVENILGSDSEVNYEAVPRCVYSSPEVAAVGLTEAEAEKRYNDVKVGRFPFIANGRAMTLSETEGLVKLVADIKSGRILGVHIVGPRASELITEAVFSVEVGATYKDIANCIHAHPTLSEALNEVALAVDDIAINI